MQFAHPGFHGTVFHVEAEDKNVLNGTANATNRVYEADGVDLEGGIASQGRSQV